MAVYSSMTHDDDEVPYGDSTFDDERWVPDDALAALTMEKRVHDDETSVERAKRLLIENVDVAAASIIWLARNSQNERIRSDSGKYIMERVLGRAGDAPATGTLDEMFDALDRLANMSPAMEQSMIQPRGTNIDE